MAPLRRAGRAALALAVLVALLLVLASQAGAQATRTWISGVGDDANPCSRTAPCKTLAGAITKTAAGGEINALDPGGFGTVTITKAITIDLSTTYRGGVLHSGTNGVLINAAATDDVVLRGIDFHGYGDGLNAVRILRARSVRIEDSSIASLAQWGVDVSATENVQVLINRVDITNATLGGIKVTPAATKLASVMVADSTIQHSGTGVSVGAGGTAWITGSTIFGNTLGIEAVAGGVLNSYTDNRIVGNTVNGTATTEIATGMQGPAGAPGATSFKLLLAPLRTSLSTRRGRRVSVNYVATGAGVASLYVVRKGRTVAKVTGKAAKAGSNVIGWNGRLAGRKAPKGAYALVLHVDTADGQHAVSTVKLRVR
ncbi:MAG: right-handed parallel beta-helix repeat-containing protein [Actinobacteria bacterium]|nr:right-handed parallel beta-helix repeat-containing protein [Actinomycetota bacterium]